MDQFWLTDEQLAKIASHLPHGQPGKPRVDDRRVINAILHVLKSAATDGHARGLRASHHDL